MFTIGKYEFNSKEQAKEKIKALGVNIDEDGNEYPTHNHSIVELGYIVLQQAEYDKEGEVVTEAVLSNKYHVDVLWEGLESHPYGWATYSIDLNEEGTHSFFGVSYIGNKM